MQPLRLIIKYPTRERPEQFAKTLHAYRTMCDDRVSTRIVVTVDADDKTMFSARDLKWPDTGEQIEIQVHHKRGKIKAINHGLRQLGEWDIILLASDDMMPQVHGYDNLIREAFTDNLDRCLWIHDGRQDKICTIVCMGRVYFERFGYLYHHDYVSLWCDNEQTDVGMESGKMLRVPCWIKNESPDWGGNQKRDMLYMRNNRHYRADERTYNRRRAKGFPLESIHK